MFFNPQQQAAQPSMFGGGQQLPPQVLQMLMQRMQQMQQQGQQPPQPQMSSPQMPPGGMNPVNVPQQGLQSSQTPMAGPGTSQQMNPLASILGNQGGAMMPQGGMNNGSGGGGNGMGGLMQIFNAIRSQQAVNGQQPPQSVPGGIDIASIINAMKGAR